MADNDPKKEQEVNSALKTRKQILENISRLDKEKAAVYRNSLNAVKDINKEEEYLNTLLGQTQDALDKVSGSLSFVYESFKDSVNEMKKGAEYTNLQKSALSKLADVARTSLDIRKGESVLEEKKFKQLQEQARIRKEDLELARRKGNFNDDEKAALKQQIKDANELQAAMKKVLETDEKILKSLGFVPKVAEGLDKALSKLGLPELGFKDALDKTRMLGQEAAHSGKSFNAVSTYTKLIVGNIKEALSFANLLTLGIGAAAVALVKADKHTGELAKNMGVSYDEAVDFHHEMTDMANTSGYLVVTTEDLIKAQMKLSDVIGTGNTLSKSLLDDFAGLTEQAGYSEEAMTAFAKVVQSTGDDLSDTTAEMLGQVELLNQQNGLSINSKQLTEEISKTAAGTVLSYGRSGKALAEAAFQAKQVGLNLEQAATISEGLLNFESSISNELEAELLTGKNLNLEKARELALNNDIAGAAKEVANQIGSAEEFTKMNRIQQEALAKSIGISRDDLAKSLMEREALARLGKQEGDIQEEYNKLVAQGLSQDQIAKKLGDEKLASQLQSVSAQEKFAAVTDKLQELFTSLVSPLLPVLQVIGDIASMLAKPLQMIGSIVKFTIEWGKYLLIPLGLIKGFQLTMQGIVALQKMQITWSSALVGLEKTKKFLGLDIFSNEVRLKAIKLANLSTRQGEVNLEILSKQIKNQDLVIQARAYAIAVQRWAGNKLDWAGEKLSLGWKYIKNQLDLKSLGIKIREFAISSKQWLGEKLSLGFQYAKNAGLTIYNSLKGISLGLETASNRKAITGLMATAGAFILNMFKAGAQAPFPLNMVLPFALGAIAGGIAGALIGKYVIKGDDVISQGYGKRTLLAGKDAIALNDEDTVIAGTDLGGKKRGKTESGTSPIDMSPLIERMSAVEGVLVQILNKNYDVYLDSTKLGTGMAIGTSKIQ